MASDSATTSERSYPIRTGCAAMGCAVAFLGAIGGAAAFMLPLGWRKIQEGQGWELALGWLILVVCVVLLPTLLLAPVLFVLAIRELQRPQLIRITATALFLPPRLQTFTRRENLSPEEAGRVRQPAEIPFPAIRSIRREDGPGGSQLLIVHDLSPETLIIEQYIMSAGDFVELDKLLRLAVPAAFVTPPPAPPST